MKRNKKIIIASGTIFVLAVALLGTVLTVRSMNKDETVLWVDGEPVSKAEFEQAMQSEYANTYDYFTRTYQASIDEKFWESTFGSETPLDYTKEIVKEKLVLEKTEQLLAQEHQLEDPVDYETKLNNWEKENKERQEKADKNEPVYGPVYLGLQQYEDKIHGELVQKIKDKLYQETNFSEDMITTYYEEHKSEYFQKASEFEIQYIKVPVPYQEEGVKEEEKDNHIKKELTAFLEELKDQEFETVAKKYQESGSIQGLAFEIEQLTKDSRTRANMIFPNVMQKLEEMRAGERSDIVEERDAYYIVECISKSEGEYETREAVEENIKRLIVEEQYDDMVKGKLEQVEIRVNQKAYDKIKFENEA